MFKRNTLKYVACVVVGSYLSLFSAESVLATEMQFTATPLLLAQAVSPLDTAPAEEAKALQQIYNEKIKRLEAEINDAKGTRKTLMTAAVASFFVGTGVIIGASSVSSAVDDIQVETPEEQDNKDQALNALDAINGVGGGIAGVGAASVVGYLIYTAIVSSKQHKIDTLRSELDVRFEPKGLTPEYLQRNESVAAVIDEIDSAKKSAGSARTMQSLFSRLAIGSLFSGGFLVGVSGLTRNSVEDIKTTDEAAKQNALDTTDNVETLGYALLGAGGACALVSFIFGRRAAGKENKVDDLENSLLRVADRIDIQPKPDGFMIMYTHKF